MAIEANLAKQAEPELSAIHVVRSSRDFTPTMPVLSVLAYRYASEGFAQFANAITVVILIISVIVTLAANRLQAKSQPWLKD